MYPGIDIIEIERFVMAFKRQPKLTERLFTTRELENLIGKGFKVTRPVSQEKRLF